jgi:hypothetical protein
MHERTVATLAVALLSWTTLATEPVAQQLEQAPRGDEVRRQGGQKGEAQDPADIATKTATFRNYNRTYQLELPEGWRQIAPGEAVRIGEDPGAPALLRLASPRSFYAVGPVDQWLAGDFTGPWLYVFEQRDEWHVDDDYAATLRDLWRQHGETNGVDHRLRDIHLEKIGAQQVECIVATRTSTPKPPAAPSTSLDVHAPTAKQQISLSFVAPVHAFDRWQPEFRKWLDTLTFARTAAEQQSLGDRLWTPMIAGGVVGLVMLVLYRYTRSRR